MKTFESHWRISSKQLWSHAKKISRDHDDAKDLLVCTQAKCWKAYASYRQERPFLNWALRVMHRLYLDDIRKRNRRVPTVSYDALPLDADDKFCNLFEDKGPSPLAEVIEQEQGDLIIASINNSRTKFIAGLIREGYKVGEIARLTGWPNSTITGRLFKERRLHAEK